MIQNIRLQHYRSYEDASFEFNTGVNIIVGPNASGKTNLLEAILVAARGSSYRVRDTDLIAFGAPWARIDAHADDTERTVKLVHDAQPEKVYEIDGRTLKRLTMEHTLPIVLFEPNHLSLLSGSPDRRREYLDELLLQTVGGYGVTLRAYRRTLAQRNRLLKSMQLTDDQLFPWNVRLSELAGRLVRARTQLVASMQATLGSLYQDLTDSLTRVSITYCAAADPEQYESHMLRQLESRLHMDVLRGFTSFGPHREDFEVRFEGRLAQEVASRGEIRTVVLCLKALELEMIEEKRETRPLLLLDDVFSELDGARRHALTTYLQSYQTFITTTDADIVMQYFHAESNVVLISREADHYKHEI